MNIPPIEVSDMIRTITGAATDLLSNEYLSSFEDSEEVSFPSVEHYCQYKILKQFGFDSAAEQIFDCVSGADAVKMTKTLLENRRVDRSAEELEKQCSEVKEKYLPLAISLRFQQDRRFQHELLHSGDALLVLCNENDRIWGVGLDEENFMLKIGQLGLTPRALFHWFLMPSERLDHSVGDNRYGICLMMLRIHKRAEMTVATRHELPSLLTLPIEPRPPRRFQDLHRRGDREFRRDRPRIQGAYYLRSDKQRPGLGQPMEQQQNDERNFKEQDRQRRHQHDFVRRDDGRKSGNDFQRRDRQKNHPRFENDVEEMKPQIQYTLRHRGPPPSSEEQIVCISAPIYKPLSNFYGAVITINGTKYASVEHFCYCKFLEALNFKRDLDEVRNHIKNPAKIFQFLDRSIQIAKRRVENFDVAQSVFEASYVTAMKQKFTEYPILQKLLMTTRDSLLVEDRCPDNKLLSIGISEAELRKYVNDHKIPTNRLRHWFSNPKDRPPLARNWGQNRTGVLLMELRAQLQVLIIPLYFHIY